MAEAIAMKKNSHYSSIEFNTNLLTNIPLETQNDQEMKVLENLSTYLKDKAIESLIEDTLFL